MPLWLNKLDFINSVKSIVVLAIQNCLQLKIKIKKHAISKNFILYKQ